MAPRKPGMHYIEVGKNYQKAPVYSDVFNEEVGMRDSPGFEKNLREFATQMRETMLQIGEGQPLDMMRLNFSYLQEEYVEQLEYHRLWSNFEQEKHDWSILYREALAGTLLVRKPGEEYPRQMQMRDGKLQLSDQMLGGVEFTGEPPKVPGAFSRFLYEWFDIKTSSMQTYLQQMDIYNSPEAVNTWLERRAQELREDGTLEIEKMEPDKRQAALQRQQAEKGPYGRTIQNNRQQNTHLQNFYKNVIALPGLVAPQPHGQAYEAETRGAVGILLCSMTEGENGKVASAGFDPLVQQMNRGIIEEVPEGLDLLHYVNSLERFDAAANSSTPEAMGALMAEALKNGGIQMIRQIKKGQGTGERLVQLSTACNRLLDFLDKPENSALKEAVFAKDGLSQKGAEAIRGIGELVGAFREGKRSQTQLLTKASQPGAEMGAERKFNLMKKILVGNQAEAILTGVKELDGFRSIGAEAMQGRHFSARYEQDYAQSSRLDSYSNQGSMHYLGVLFSNSGAITEMNQRILGDAAGVLPKGIEPEAPKKSHVEEVKEPLEYKPPHIGPGFPQ